MMKYTLVIFICFAQTLLGQVNDIPVKQLQAVSQDIEFVENKGQWKSNIQFKSNLPSGNLFIESGVLTYVFYSQEDLDHIHDLRHGKKQLILEDIVVDAHAFQVQFPESNRDVVYKGRDIKSNYNNYFIGKKKSHWATNVPIYEEAYGKNLWPNIDHRIYSTSKDLKYDFVIHPGGNAKDILMKFDHLENIRHKHGNLYLSTSVNELIDMKPVAFQKGQNGYEAVPCSFNLKGESVSFDFPEGYDESKTLIIDPQLIFSSYSGSTQDNWGFTATFDEAGNLYAGGIVFSDTNRSYPTTLGAFQINQSSGLSDIDMGITKFNASGTGLVYSTYIGGNRHEIPHSLVVNKKNELIIMGTTSSQDYPITIGAYDSTYNISGSASIQVATKNFLGADLVLTKLAPNGSSLMGSTYIGGTGFDGINYNNLEYNYGDNVRGEVFVDENDMTYVASTTASTDFPVTNSSVHRGGVQEAIVFKMDSSFSNLLYSTYLGGNSNDAAYGIQVDKFGRAYIAGGTASSNFPTTSGTITPTYKGGIDGFVTILNSAGNILASSFIGTSSYDQAYFVQLDDNNNVFVTGQTEGNYPVYPAGVYSNPYSGQFIHKMNSNLTSTVFSTVIGTGGSSGNVDVDISPSAFLVNQCNHIYLAGWGGDINRIYSSATSSTTTGLPITQNSYKTTTDGNDFYLIVLDEDADSLLYATFFGGNSAYLRGEHVDGGTSRFDKKGIVYQAVCAGCGSSNSFPTGPSGVWSTTNQSNNCNLGVIKFDLSQLTSDIAMSALTKVCIPGTVTFNNTSNGGNSYFWDFGDGSTSNQFQPTHTYIDTGDFQVMLIVSDTLSCILQDTSYITIRGQAPPIASIDSIPISCPGDSIQLKARGGVIYKWISGGTVSNDTVFNPFATPVINSSYTVVVGDSCGSDTAAYFAYDTATVFISIAKDLTSISPDDTICKGESSTLLASGGLYYQWDPPTFLNKSNVASPVTTPSTNISYTVEIWDQYNCKWTQNINLFVEDSLDPPIYTSSDTTICLGDSILIYTSGGNKYSWEPTAFMASPSESSSLIWPKKETNYLVTITSKCFKAIDTVLVSVNDFKTEAMPDTIACADVPLKLTASPGEIFIWEPSNLLDSTSEPFALIKERSLFTVLAYDSMGCSDMDTLIVDLKSPPYVSAGNDQIISKSFTQIEARGKGSVSWEPKDMVICPECPNTEVEIPRGSFLFTVTLTDEYGCVSSDDVLITRLDDDLFVPNSFTPNNDMINDVFQPIGRNVENYKLTIYNRWGQVIYISEVFDIGWDGTYDGKESGNGVYVWEIQYTQNDEGLIKKGTVSLIR